MDESRMEKVSLLMRVLFTIGSTSLIAFVTLTRTGQTAVRDAGAAVIDKQFICVLYRSDCSRSQSDMRSLATALESYYVDHEAYPEPDRLSILTTPVSYITKLPADGFTAEPRWRFYYQGRYFTHSYDMGTKPHAYWMKNDFWLLYSPGPDLDNDIEPFKFTDRSVGEILMLLPTLTYDPTNGTTSDGDIWRSKQ